MNSGAATIGNEFIACAIFCGTIDGDSPPKPTNANAASPIEAKSGTPDQDGEQPDADDLQHQVRHRRDPRRRRVVAALAAPLGDLAGSPAPR